MAGRLEGKVCVITGAAGGIGGARAGLFGFVCAGAGGGGLGGGAALFGSEGARVVGVDLAEGAPGELSLQVDVTDDAAVREMYARVRDELGRIDVLFNNAGISPTDDGSG